jgi:hypothetical protein
MRELTEISAGEMRERLREAFAADPERSLLVRFGRQFLDPLQPEGADGRRRVYPLWILLALAMLVSLGLFLYAGFSSS